MVFIFKKRTTKSVGQKIAKDLRDITRQEKVARTLEKEKEVRLKRQKLDERVMKLKAERPTAFKTIGKGLVNVGRAISVGAKRLQPPAPMTKSRRRKSRQREFQSFREPVF